MERVGLLTGDPLRLGGAGLAARALRRLDAASSRIGPLEHAGRGLAPLRRARLTELTSPTSGDEALAAALARCAAAAAVDAEPATHTRRHLARPPAVAARFGGGGPTSPGPREPISGRFDRLHQPVAGSVRLAEPASSAVGGRRRHVPLRPARRRSLERRVVEPFAPAPPPGFEQAEGALGLEWLVIRLPGGPEASETPLVEGSPEPGGSTLASRVATSSPAVRVMRAPQEQTQLGSSLGAVERALETPPPAPPIAAPAQSVLLPTGARGLGALVRAWQDTGQVPAEPSELPAPPVPAPTNGSSDPGQRSRTSRERPEARASAREDELAAFGDALGRTLVAELRRYGIEVDEG